MKSKTVCVTRIGNMKDPNEATRGTVGIVEFPVKELRPSDVLIKVAYCGICGSDPHIVDGCFGGEPPFGIGHEVSGVIEALGPSAKAKGLKVGDKVGGNFLGYCGKCYYCTNGMPEYCEDVWNEPCMAEYVVWDESQVSKLPEGVSLKEGAIMEPLSIAVRTLDKANMQVGKKVLVSGGGPIGQLVCQLFAKFGAAELTLSEPNPKRRELAKKIGVEHLIDPITEDVRKRAMEITNGIGYDVLVECSAVPSAGEMLLDIAAKYANLIYTAQFPNDYFLPVSPFNHLYLKQYNITSMYCAHFNFDRTAAYLKYVDLSAFTADDQVFELDDIQEAFKAHLSGEYPKILVRCNKFDGE